jgi:2-polyprenyl-3-methyl-5-hydroxy-6-metoxy-1,4-benzoquinol methylase
MVYADPVSQELASGAFYEARPLYLMPEKLAGDYAPVRFERELRLFRSWCPDGSVLDAGCSTGAFLFQLKARHGGDYEVVGTDVAGPALDYAESRGVPVRRGDFLQMDWAGRGFDAVTFWAVFEHLADPGTFLQKAAEILKPGGHCFVLVPNTRSLAVRLLGSRYRYVMREHLNYFDEDTLRTFVKREPRFQIVHVGYSHFNPMVIWQDLWSRPHEVTDEARVRLLKRTTGWKQDPRLRPIKRAHAAIEGILGALGLADNLVIVLRRRAAV